MRLALLLDPGAPPKSLPVEALVLSDPAAWGMPDVEALRRWAGAPPLYALLDAGTDGLDAAIALGLDGIVSTVEDARAAGRLAARLAVREAEAGRRDGATRLLAVIATARAALEATRIAGAGPRMAGLAFDGPGLARSMGLPHASPPSPAGEGTLRSRGGEGSDGAVRPVPLAQSCSVAPLSRPSLTREPPSPAGGGGSVADPGSLAAAHARGLVLLAAAAHGLPTWDILPSGAHPSLAAAARRDGFAGVITRDPALTERLARGEPS